MVNLWLLFAVVGSTFVSLAVVINAIAFLEGDLKGLYQALSLAILFLPILVISTLAVHRNIP